MNETEEKLNSDRFDTIASYSGDVGNGVYSSTRILIDNNNEKRPVKFEYMARDTNPYCRIMLWSNASGWIEFANGNEFGALVLSYASENFNEETYIDNSNTCFDILMKIYLQAC